MEASHCPESLSHGFTLGFRPMVQSSQMTAWFTIAPDLMTALDLLAYRDIPDGEP